MTATEIKDKEFHDRLTGQIAPGNVGVFIVFDGKVYGRQAPKSEWLADGSDTIAAKIKESMAEGT